MGYDTDRMDSAGVVSSNKSASYLARLFFCTSAFVFATFILGPYRYHVYSWIGLAYYLEVNLLFMIGLASSGWHLLPNRRKLKNGGVVEKTLVEELRLSQFAKKTLVVGLTVSIVCCLLYCFELISIVGFESIIQAGDYRSRFSEVRSPFSKFCEIGMFIGPAAFLVTSQAGFLRSRLVQITSFLGLMLPGLVTLVLGARWRIFLLLLIYLFYLVLKKRDSCLGFRACEKSRSMLKASRAGVLRFGTTIKLVLVFVGFGLVAWVFFQLFKNRGLLSAQDMYLFFPGDMELRPLYEHLLTMSSGALAPLYKAANYIAQSPAVFSELFDAHLPENAYFGAYTFRIAGYLLPFVPSLDRIFQDAFSGFYSGFVYGFIVDWGVLATPILAFCVGHIASKIEQCRIENAYCRIVYPLVCAMVACAPVYYFFQVGSADFILFWLMIYFGLVRNWKTGSSGLRNSCDR